MKNINNSKHFKKLYRTTIVSVLVLFFLTAITINAHSDDWGKGGKRFGGGHSIKLIAEGLEDADLTDEQTIQIKALYAELDSRLYPNLQNQDRNGKRNGKRNGGGKRSKNGHNDRDFHYGFDGRGGQYMLQNQTDIKALILKDTITEGDLNSLFEKISNNQPVVINQDLVGYNIEFLAGVHGILSKDQRVKFVEAIKEEINEKKGGSVFRNLFSSPVDRIKSRLTDEIGLDAAQQTLLEAVLPTDDEVQKLRDARYENMLVHVELFNSETLTVESLKASMDAYRTSMRTKMFATVQEMAVVKFPAAVKFHASLSAAQKQIMAARMGSGWHGRGRR